MLCERCGEPSSWPTSIDTGSCAELCTRCRRDWLKYQRGTALEEEQVNLGVQRQFLVLRSNSGMTPDRDDIEVLIRTEMEFAHAANRVFEAFVKNTITRDSEGNPCS